MAKRNKAATSLPIEAQTTSSQCPKVIGYIRVSTDEQAKEGMSLSFQRRKIEAYCELHDLYLLEILEDAGRSGRDRDRPAYQQLLQRIIDPDISGVIVYRLDRLTRSFGELGVMLETFKKHDASIFSVMENVDASTAIGRFVLGLLGLIANLEVDVLGELVATGMEEAKRQGLHVGSTPLGYQRGEQKGELVIDEKESEIVERIYHLRTAEQMSFRRIAEVLNEEGHPTKRGGRWGSETVRLVWQRRER
jgi:DNA invertase Pin-like site-specific DNA recombinase